MRPMVFGGLGFVFWEKVEVFIRQGVVGKGKLEILSERETEIAGQCSERG
jgi:hypothetical protein